MGKLLVVQAQEVQHGGMQVMRMDLVLHGLRTAFVGTCHRPPPPGSTTGHPESKAAVVMAASFFPISQRSTAKLTAPYQQCILEHIAILEVLDQRRDWLVDRLAVGLDLDSMIPMSIPVRMTDLDVPHACFGQPTSPEALSAEVIVPAPLLGNRPVSGQSCDWLKEN